MNKRIANAFGFLLCTLIAYGFAKWLVPEFCGYKDFWIGYVAGGINVLVCWGGKE